VMVAPRNAWTIYSGCSAKQGAQLISYF
jgi:hypothetical protein